MECHVIYLDLSRVILGRGYSQGCISIQECRLGLALFTSRMREGHL